VVALLFDVIFGGEWDRDDLEDGGAG